MKKYKYNIVNLDCVMCAKKVEDYLNKYDKLKNVKVDFIKSKISYETDDVTIKELNKLIKKIEGDAKVVEYIEDHKKEYHLWIFIIALLIGIIGIFFKLPLNLNIIFQIISYILLLYRCFVNAIKIFIGSKTIDENLLITISCIGAFILGEVFEGIMVISLYTIGKILEEKALNNSRKSISDLMNIKEYIAHKIYNSKQIDINVEDVLIDDILIVKKGEKIPVDGIIVSGNTLLDTSSLTGESELINCNVGDKVLSGSINTENIINIKATSTYENSTVSKILNLIDNAESSKSKTETFVSKASKIYTPIILILSIVVVVLLPILTNVTLNEAIYRALTFLVISCPCAIAISVPLSYFSGIGISSSNGILIKGSNFLDNLSNITKIVFDKTGTITNGSFKIEDIKIYDKNYSQDEIINILINGEELSNHPIAKSILNLKNNKYKIKKIKNYKELDGIGITYTYENKNIKVGNDKICNCNNKNVLHLNIDNSHIASIIINDGIKDNVKSTIEKLKSIGIKTFMFTGDKMKSTLSVAKKVGIENIKYEMLPNEKYTELQSLKSDKDIVMFVGDGINDAPVLKCADIGVSMGNIGSSVAIEASDIILIKDDISKIVTSIKISKYTNKIIRQNFIFALSVKLIILLLSIFGITTMVYAVFSDTGVTLISILNTLRIMNKNYNI